MIKLVEGLKHFQAHIVWQRQELFERSVYGQKPQALLITCSDSRVLPETLLQADPGDLFVLRNAGNLIPPPHEPSGEAATIEYAINALGVTDVVVCGHYRCGAVRAILHPGEGAGLPKIQEWLARSAETKAVIEGQHPGLDGEALWDKAVERNVLAQIANLAQHPAVAAALAAGRVRLHAWVLRFETSDVLAFDPSANAFVPLLEMPAVPATHPTPVSTPSSTAVLESPDRIPPSTNSKWSAALKHDLPASLVVFAVALPFCIAIARACGVPAAAGIVSAVIGGLVLGLLGGAPLQVSGPTAGLIVILLRVVDQRGLAALAAVVVLAGWIQITAGLLRLGQWFRVVSPAVILGMLSGIGAALVAQQFHITVDDMPSSTPVANLLEIPRAFWDIFDGHDGHPGHLAAAFIGLLTLAVLIVWKPLRPKRLQAVPSVLVAVGAATAIASLLRLPIQRVEFDSLASGLGLLDFPAFLALSRQFDIWQFALTVAIVATAETLLTAAAVDQMHAGPRTNYNRELTAQGMGNVLCGLLGALPLASVIVRSSANVQAGAKSRWATVLHAIWLFAFVLLVPGLLRLIPTSALAAILVLTGINLIKFHAIHALWRESRTEGLISIAVAVTAVAVDLLAGVTLGVALSLIKLVYTFSRLSIRRREDSTIGRLVLTLEGSATFILLPKLASALESVPSNTEVHIDITRLSYIDHACLQLLAQWEKRLESVGGRLILDWETMRARYQTARPRPIRDSATTRYRGEGIRDRCA